MMPSGSEWRQPYTLSNLDLVTESLTLMAGTISVLLACISYRRFTPVVVSSEMPARGAAVAHVTTTAADPARLSAPVRAVQAGRKHI